MSDQAAKDMGNWFPGEVLAKDHVLPAMEWVTPEAAIDDDRLSTYSHYLGRFEGAEDRDYLAYFTQDEDDNFWVMGDTDGEEDTPATPSWKRCPPPLLVLVPAPEPLGQEAALTVPGDRDAAIEILLQEFIPNIRRTPEDYEYYGGLVDRVAAALAAPSVKDMGDRELRSLLEKAGEFIKQHDERTWDEADELLAEISAALSEASKASGPSKSPKETRNAVIELPPLTDAMIEAACIGHYGKKNVKASGGYESVDMTAAGENYTFPEAFRRMWTGVQRALKSSPVSADATGLCSDCPPVGYPTDKTRCDECPRAADIGGEQ